MICEVCRQKNANVIFKTITDGQVATRAMCMECAQNLQQDMYRVFLALGLKPDAQAQQEQSPAQREEKAPGGMPRYLCAHCGRPFDSLDEHTMAGCAYCYSAMEKELTEELAGEKADEAAPARDKREDAEDGRTELKYRLLEAVMKEDYEEAARLRDQISAQGEAGPAEEEP